MRILACYSIKGGVGKTTTAINVAYLASLLGWRTLLWDLDPQGAATFCLRADQRLKGGARRLTRTPHNVARQVCGTEYPNLDVLPADFSLRHLDTLLKRVDRPKRWLRSAVKSLMSDYDLVVLDCAPSISLASENVFRACDMLLVPVIPSPLSLRTLAQLRRHLRRKGPSELELLAFFSMADGRKGLHKKTLALALGGERILARTVIPYASPVEAMTERRAPLEVFARHHPAAAAYRRLWTEIDDRLFAALDEGRRKVNSP